MFGSRGIFRHLPLIDHVTATVPTIPENRLIRKIMRMDVESVQAWKKSQADRWTAARLKMEKQADEKLQTGRGSL